jgi:hypothetical protein
MLLQATMQASMGASFDLLHKYPFQVLATALQPGVVVREEKEKERENGGENARFVNGSAAKPTATVDNSTMGIADASNFIRKAARCSTSPQLTTTRKAPRSVKRIDRCVFTPSSKKRTSPS